MKSSHSKTLSFSMIFLDFPLCFCSSGRDVVQPLGLFLEAGPGQRGETFGDVVWQTSFDPKSWISGNAHMEVSIVMGVPNNGWFLLGTIPLKNRWFGGPSISGNAHIFLETLKLNIEAVEICELNGRRSHHLPPFFRILAGGGGACKLVRFLGSHLTRGFS